MRTRRLVAFGTAALLAASVIWWPAPSAQIGQLEDPRPAAPRMHNGQRPDRPGYPSSLLERTGR